MHNIILSIYEYVNSTVTIQYDRLLSMTSPIIFPLTPTFSFGHSLFSIRVQYLLKFAFYIQGKILTLGSEQYYHSSF